MCMCVSLCVGGSLNVFSLDFCKTDVTPVLSILAKVRKMQKTDGKNVT